MTRSLPRATTALLALVLGAAGAAQTPRLISDVNRQGLNPSSAPEQIVRVGNELLLVATTATTGAELFETLGQPGSTGLVRDIRPGASGSDLRHLTVLGTTLLFSADDGVRGRELWRSDGTTAGTVLVRDIEPGAVGAAPSNLTVVGGVLYFAASDGANGEELWRSDGTAAGTVLVADIVPGTAGSQPRELHAFGSTLLFRAGRGDELWKSDGTAAGTVLLRAFPLFNLVRDFNELAGESYFIVAGPAQLWKTDGTAAGTALVRDFGVDAILEDIFATPSALYTLSYRREGFSQASALSLFLPGSGWRALSSTTLAIPFPTGRFLGAQGERVFFTDPFSVLKVTNGTESGTITLPISISGSSMVDSTVAVGGEMFFSGLDSNGSEPWKSDGTPAGTVRIADIVAGAGSSSPTRFAPDLGGTGVLFAANDQRTGEELWTSSGTAATTLLVDDIDPLTAETPGSWPHLLVDVQGLTYFVADDGIHGDELWVTDGTDAGTKLVMDLAPGPLSSFPHQLTRVGSRVFFVATDQSIASAYFLCVSDGTAAGTGIVDPTLFVTLRFGVDNELTGVGNRLFFHKDEEVWVSDGTASGTRIVRPITPPSVEYLPPRALTAAGAWLYFSHDDGTNGRELWRSDGTQAGTVMVADIAAGGMGSHPFSLTVLEDILLFAAQDASGDRELWRSDGTAAGTTRVANLAAGASSSPASLVTAGERVFFTADDGVVGRELWVTDGTAVGTRIVADLTPGSGSSLVSSPTAVGDRLFFLLDDEGTGRELWVSDGTAAGTSLVREILPGPASPELTSLRAVGSRWLWFAADDRIAGRELWRSDGTAEGTVRVTDLHPGAASAEIREPTLSRGTLLFAGDDGFVGQEPFGLFPGATAQAIGDSCGAPDRTPRLTADDPVLGTTTTLAGTGTLTGGITVVLLGIPHAALPLGGGCSLYMEPSTMLVLSYQLSTSRWSLPLFVPRLPALVGGTLAVQALSGPTSAPPGLETTNAVYLTFGP